MESLGFVLNSPPPSRVDTEGAQALQVSLQWAGGSAGGGVDASAAALWSGLLARCPLSTGPRSGFPTQY